MSQNIKNNHVRYIDSKLYNKHYYDYMLFRGETVGDCEFDLDEKLIADFSTLDITSGMIYSTRTWSEAKNNGVELQDIGFTGIDNGFIRYDKDRISNEDFLKILTNSEYSIESGDTRFFMTPVTGNTKLYQYPMYLVETDNGNYIACKGGFYQGFFKLDGFDYEVLPSTMMQDILLHFEIRPRSDYETSSGTVNTIHPENDGTFFFIGTRAENKFWPYYKTDSATTMSNRRPDSEIPYDADELCIMNNQEWLQGVDLNYVVGEEYQRKCKNSGTIITDVSILQTDETYMQTYDFYPEGNCECINCGGGGEQPEPCSGDCADIDCSQYFTEDYLHQGKNCPEDNGKAVVDGYVKDDIDIRTVTIEDSAGNVFGTRDNYVIWESDNKFLMFDRTEDGFTTDTWEEGTLATITTRKNWPNENYFLIMNRTETGYTTDTIDQYNKEFEYDYNIYKDIRNNVFSLRITENGAIGYRYGILNCDDDVENHYELIEEYSKDGMVNLDEWNSINVRFAVINPPKDKCDKRPRKMRIMFYVNGYLKLISKELDTFSFRALDETSERQEGVPYNISLGGGSIGLLETILPNYYKIPEYILPIEKDFCGTFIGDIKSFKIYYGFISYSCILNYLS